LWCLAYFISANEHRLFIRSVMKLFKTFKTPENEVMKILFTKSFTSGYLPNITCSIR